MGTRGFVGFVNEGDEKIAYNHMDSYPGGLGEQVLSWLHGRFLGDWANLPSHYAKCLETMKREVGAVRLVDEDREPTVDEIKWLTAYTERGVGSGEVSDWYILLHGTQGSPAAMLKAGYMLDAHEFPYDSLFAEWGYIVDLDTARFEVYKGFQEQPHNEGRFVNRGYTPRQSSSGRLYHPCRLLCWWPLDNLPQADDFTKQINSLAYDGD